jgi:hypothetical protein
MRRCSTRLPFLSPILRAAAAAAGERRRRAQAPPGRRLRAAGSSCQPLQRPRRLQRGGGGASGVRGRGPWSVGAGCRCVAGGGRAGAGAAGVAAAAPVVRGPAPSAAPRPAARAGGASVGGAEAAPRTAAASCWCCSRRGPVYGCRACCSSWGGSTWPPIKVGRLLFAAAAAMRASCWRMPGPSLQGIGNEAGVRPTLASLRRMVPLLSSQAGVAHSGRQGRSLPQGAPPPARSKLGAPSTPR